MAAAIILYFNTKRNKSAADCKRFIKFCRNVVSCYWKWIMLPESRKVVNSRWRWSPF